MSVPGLQSFSNAHRAYVKTLYKAYLVNARDWIQDRALWRQRCIEIRAEFERNRNITDPRALAIVLEQAEQRLADIAHPSPYIHPHDPDGSKWERNIPPRMFSEEEKQTAIREMSKFTGPY